MLLYKIFSSLAIVTDLLIKVLPLCGFFFYFHIFHMQLFKSIGVNIILHDKAYRYTRFVGEL